MVPVLLPLLLMILCSVDLKNPKRSLCKNIWNWYHCFSHLDHYPFFLQEEIYKLRKEHLKKEEIDLIMEKEQLERDKQLHLRELKRAANERDSRYKDHEMLSNKRYLLLSLQGKGGFRYVIRPYRFSSTVLGRCFLCV